MAGAVGTDLRDDPWAPGLRDRPRRGADHEVKDTVEAFDESADGEHDEWPIRRSSGAVASTTSRRSGPRYGRA